ncbi:hypothetical protein HDV06_003669, partial [Boothiomyces sp. JEL0866]
MNDQVESLDINTQEKLEQITEITSELASVAKELDTLSSSATEIQQAAVEVTEIANELSSDYVDESIELQKVASELNTVAQDSLEIGQIVGEIQNIVSELDSIKSEQLIVEETYLQASKEIQAHETRTELAEKPVNDAVDDVVVQETVVVELSEQTQLIPETVRVVERKVQEIVISTEQVAEISEVEHEETITEVAEEVQADKVVKDAET